MAENKIFENIGLTFDDVLLIPQKSDVLPKDCSLNTFFTKDIPISIPLVSAAMDTVTEHMTAIVLAQEGGIGVIHRNLSIQRQAEEVNKVKRYESVIIEDPITLSPDNTVKDAKDIMNKYKISGLPIVVKNKKLVGIITRRDIHFAKKLNEKISSVMTKNVITADENISIKKAEEILNKNKIEKLPIVDKNGILKGLITMKDIEKRKTFPNATKDRIGRLRVAAAVGCSEDTMDRVEALINVGVDAIVIDTAHAHSKRVIETIKMIKKKFNISLVAGNVATSQATKELIRLGVDAIKVGIGPGSICTTRIIAGVGVPQFTAIYECAKETKKAKIPLIADGGIRYSGDIVKALAVGASCVMIGNLFAGTDESPGDLITLEGKKFKVYNAMGSLAAMKKASKDRYFQEGVPDTKLVPEGVEARVPYRGSLAGCILQLIGGIKSGMGYCGARTIQELQKKAKFIRMTQAGLYESHPHNVIITSEPPNYWM
jgi:IMP dehydrogenase